MKRISFLLLAGALTASYAIAEEETATIRVESEGNKIEIKPDGSKSIERKDGTVVEIHPDGSKLIRKADGTSVEIRADGSKLIKKPDGTTVEVKAGDRGDW